MRHQAIEHKMVEPNSIKNGGMRNPKSMVSVGINLNSISMSKDDKEKKANHEADIQNPNKGTDGTNKTYDKNQGNRGKQLNPNQNQDKGKK